MSGTRAVAEGEDDLLARLGAVTDADDVEFALEPSVAGDGVGHRLRQAVNFTGPDRPVAALAF